MSLVEIMLPKLSKPPATAAPPAPVPPAPPVAMFELNVSSVDFQDTDVDHAAARGAQPTAAGSFCRRWPCWSRTRCASEYNVPLLTKPPPPAFPTDACSSRVASGRIKVERVGEEAYVDTAQVQGAGVRCHRHRGRTTAVACPGAHRFPGSPVTEFDVKVL